jgi:hypothetical protein
MKQRGARIKAPRRTGDRRCAAAGLPSRHCVEVWYGDNKAWLRVVVRRSELRRRGLGPVSLPRRAHHFGSVFRHVDSAAPTVSYESTQRWGSRCRTSSRKLILGGTAGPASSVVSVPARRPARGAGHRRVSCKPTLGIKVSKNRSGAVSSREVQIPPPPPDSAETGLSKRAEGTGAGAWARPPQPRLLTPIGGAGGREPHRTRCFPGAKNAREFYGR